MSNIRVFTVAEVDPVRLNIFLGRHYSEGKARFLQNHGAWWHQGNEHRWVMLDGNEIAAYCAVIPGKILSGGKEREVAWWIDLIVAPEFRGRGLQRLFDEKVKEFSPLIVGFPNALAAKIHRRHGWGVVGDLRVLLMPLRPAKLRAVERRRGFARFILSVGAIATLIPAAFLRWRLARHKPRWARRLEDPSTTDLVEGAKHAVGKGVTTTVRDSEWFEWRYIQAPYREDLRFYGAGRTKELQLTAVTRDTMKGGHRTVRILDLFGAIEDRELVRDILLLAAKDAAKAGAEQVTIMVTNKRLSRQVRRLGFVGSSTAHFCCWSEDRGLVAELAEHDMYWVLADSDNDEQ